VNFASRKYPCIWMWNWHMRKCELWDCGGNS
jgi:hypothetical protein